MKVLVSYFFVVEPYTFGPLSSSRSEGRVDLFSFHSYLFIPPWFISGGWFPDGYGEFCSIDNYVSE